MTIERKCNDLAAVTRTFNTETERDDLIELAIRIKPQLTWIAISDGELERLTMAVNYLNRELRAFEKEKRQWDQDDSELVEATQQPSLTHWTKNHNVTFECGVQSGMAVPELLWGQVTCRKCCALLIDHFTSPPTFEPKDQHDIN